ncbi:invasion protein IalB [Neorhizobium sp. 2083]|uniref:invasion associated locus B family protein n=1 Tax=Neorhizobium sp. 2083 TaxID=2817762 RepID=UPI000DE039A5|nr:invasion associated locus B family protein [Neorhizobium sp. 2083]MDR6819429.1 invasion protein IalB [Neorhizobium sp. 2083]
MSVRTIATALAILAASSGLASAQAPKATAPAKPQPAQAAPAAGPTRIQQFKAWGAYSYKSGASNVCYVLSVPTTKEPASVDHGDIFFIVSQRPGQNISYEPQAMVGYVLQPNSKVTVTIDKKNFTMFTKDKAAWVENAAEEPALVAAMKTGHNMSVSAVSGRGTKTSYAYSLQGIAAALKQIETCK